MKHRFPILMLLSYVFIVAGFMCLASLPQGFPPRSDPDPWAGVGLIVLGAVALFAARRSPHR